MKFHDHEFLPQNEFSRLTPALIKAAFSCLSDARRLTSMSWCQYEHTEEDVAALRREGPGPWALWCASLGDNICGSDVPEIVGVPIDQPLYLKNAIDPTLYLQVEEGCPDGPKLMFKAKPENIDESSMPWLAERMSAYSFSLKHVKSGCVVECCRRDDDPQATLCLRSGRPFFGQKCVEFIHVVRRKVEDEAAPFRLECTSMKSPYLLSKDNQRSFMVDSRIVDWPRVEPGDNGWLIGCVEPALGSGEDLRGGGHIFLWEKVVQKYGSL